MTYASAKFEVATSNGLKDAFTRKYIVWPYVQCPYHMTYASAKFEIAMCNGLGNAFTRNNITMYLTLT